MELRVLHYFLAIAREESITGAAKSLHISQPALSRQIMDLEAEIGKPLMHRGSRRVTLTEEGRLLRKRAEEILALVRKTEGELAQTDEQIAGDIYLCAGETQGVHFLAEAGAALRRQYPDIRLHISSGDTLNVYSALDKGIADFGLMFEQPDLKTYEFLPLPQQDHFGVLMGRNAPLARKEQITPDDLAGQPLIVQRGMLSTANQSGWDKEYREKSKVLGSESMKFVGNRMEEWGNFLSGARIVGSYSLLYNASLMVRAGMGYALGLDGIITPSAGSDLCFRPLLPAWTATPYLVWKRYQVFSKAAEQYLELLQKGL